MTTDGWTPKPGDKVQVPVVDRRGYDVWWGAEVRTVAPPYVRVMRLVAHGRSRHVATLETYRIDQVRPGSAGSHAPLTTHDSPPEAER